MVNYSACKLSKVLEEYLQYVTWWKLWNRYKKRQHSSARSELGNLDPVEEEVPVVQDVRDFKIRRLSENRPAQDSGI